MSEELKKLIIKAKRSLRAARRLYKNADYDFSVSSAYYAKFYCAEAMLLTQGLSYSKHSGVIAAFGRHFVKTGLLPSSFHSSFLTAFKDRQIGDYEVIKKISKQEAETNIKNAKEFINQAVKYLKEKGVSL